MIVLSNQEKYFAFVALVQQPSLWYISRMNKEQLIKLAGSQTELAKLLGISQPAVSAWKEVPQARIWQLKLLKPKWFKEQK